LCHDAPGHHDKVELWSKSAHASYELTSEATTDSRGATAAHCGRCHAAQGFATYAAQQQAGNPGNIARPTTNRDGTPFPAVPAGCTAGASCDQPFIDYLSGLGLTDKSAENLSCVACHEPHRTELRVKNDTGPLAGGFSVGGAGNGAICMVCHNT